MAKVSVIIPAYNYADYLPEAIESVLNQTFDDFELLVVDDGSTDNTREVMRTFVHDPKVRYLYQDNQGLAAARNAGIRNTHGEFVAFLDADDVWLERKLENQVDIMDSKPEVGLVYTDIYFIDGEGKILTDRQWARRRKKTMFEDLLFSNVITGSASSSLIRRECLDRVGLFDETFKSLEDLDLWLRIARHSEFERVDERLAEGWLAYLAKREVPDQYKSAETLARFEILSRIARQYYELGQMKKYRYYAVRALISRPQQVANPSFWKGFVGSYLGKRSATSESWVTRTLRN
jgi:glycosyltransferase involved in cell wall biosynthesis